MEFWCLGLQGFRFCGLNFHQATKATFYDGWGGPCSLGKACSGLPET